MFIQMDMNLWRNTFALMGMTLRYSRNEATGPDRVLAYYYEKLPNNCCKCCY